MKTIVFTIIFSLVFPILSFAQSANIGIVDGIWFSDDIFFAGDPIRIYTAIQNNSGEDIQGRVEFFDNDISIGSKEFTTLNNRLSEVWLDAIITEGTHDYSVAITEAAINKPGEATEPITPRVITSQNTLIADVDTDGDNIGDTDDDDDDNDGFSDIEELAAGTDSLDSTSKPREEEPESDFDSEEESILDQVIAILSGSNSDNRDAENSKEDSTEPESVDEVEPITNPQFIQNIEATYPIVTRITKPINSVQNTIVPRIEQEKKRVSVLRDDANVLNTSNESTVEGEFPEYKEKREFAYWMYSFYQFMLSVISWVFSCIFCMIILLFIALHLVLKILFKLFRNRFGHIRS